MTSKSTNTMQLRPLSWAAEILSVSDDTVRRLISRGELPGYKIGNGIRVREADVYAAIKPIPTGGKHSQNLGARE